MTTSLLNDPFRAQAIDWLFTHVQGGREGPGQAPPPEGPRAVGPSPAEVTMLKEAQPPPPINGPDDL